MKRTTLYLVAASFLLLGNAKQASACCYIPWLDPLAWLGFYGCGPNPWMGGCGAQCSYGGGYGGYGGGYGVNYGYAQPTYTGYAPSYPAINYQAAPAAPACGCQGAALPQPQLSAVRVPVTTYRAVTQYVPQTTYRTQYQYQTPQLAYGQQTTQQFAYGQQATQQFAYSQPTAPLAYGYTAGTTAYGYGATSIPTNAPATTAYNVAPVNGYTSYDANPAPSQSIQSYPAPTAPTSPGFYQPRTFQAPMGDVAGDHELYPQAATIPVIPNSYSGTVPVRRATYGAAPRTTRSFSTTVR